MAGSRSATDARASQGEEGAVEEAVSAPAVEGAKSSCPALVESQRAVRGLCVEGGGEGGCGWVRNSGLCYSTRVRTLQIPRLAAFASPSPTVFAVPPTQPQQPRQLPKPHAAIPPLLLLLLLLLLQLLSLLLQPAFLFSFLLVLLLLRLLMLLYYTRPKLYEGSQLLAECLSLVSSTQRVELV